MIGMDCSYVLVRPVGVFPTRAAAMEFAGCSEEDCVRMLAGMTAAGEEICTGYFPGELQPFFRVQPHGGGGFLLLAGNRALALESRDQALSTIEKIKSDAGEQWTYLIDLPITRSLN